MYGLLLVVTVHPMSQCECDRHEHEEWPLHILLAPHCPSHRHRCRTSLHAIWSDTSVHPHKVFFVWSYPQDVVLFGNGYSQTVGSFENYPQKVNSFECYTHKVTFFSRSPTIFFKSYRVTHRKMCLFCVCFVFVLCLFWSYPQKSVLFLSYPQKTVIVWVYPQKRVSLKKYPRNSGKGFGLPICVIKP